MGLWLTPISLFLPKILELRLKKDKRKKTEQNKTKNLVGEQRKNYVNNFSYWENGSRLTVRASNRFSWKKYAKILNLCSWDESESDIKLESGIFSADQVNCIKVSPDFEEDHAIPALGWRDRTEGNRSRFLTVDVLNGNVRPRGAQHLSSMSFFTVKKYLN